MGFIKTFLHMWDAEAHHNTDRKKKHGDKKKKKKKKKKNVEITPCTECTWTPRGSEREREREREREQTFHLPCFFRCTDGTVKHQQDGLLLRGKKGAGREQGCQMSVS